MSLLTDLKARYLRPDLKARYLRQIVGDMRKPNQAGF